MKTFVGIEALQPPENGSVITVGTFDGFHLGHRGLVTRTIDAARELGAESVVLTWDRHPAATLRPDRLPPLLSSAERKVELIEASGADVLAVLPFDTELSKQMPEAFVQDVLVRGLGLRSIFIGHDWRFGHKAAGDVGLLARLGEELGFDVHGVDLQTIAGEPVTSSRVRRAIAEGDLPTARVLLGRPFDIDGIVVKGAGRGKDLGYPTANLALDPQLARPPRGVYAGMAHIGGATHPTAVNVGVNPTFGGDPKSSPVTIEPYLLDFDRDLYGETLRVEFWERLRDELRFDSAADLVVQMAADVEATRALVTPQGGTGRQ
ncbi:MAG: bifunctional riboflavin kinase/FAD synthetase [Actinomycetota bacterium]